MVITMTFKVRYSLLYAVTVAIAMFIMPVIYHLMHYHQFAVEKFLLTTKKYVLIVIVCVMLAYVTRSRIGIGFQVTNSDSYGLASLHFILIFLRFLRHSQEMSFGGT